MSAASHIAKAIEHLREARHELRTIRSAQHVPIAVKIAQLEEIFDAITEPAPLVPAEKGECRVIGD
ncbi:hypothetical protein [Cohnella sp. GCM10012308]|uniref:hypothetical protein n=1 Tax=Cohnella sp. GCM10012308 TaxID=3317329 RepID=UPI003623F4B8